MRKELGKPTRELFFARLLEVAPEFRRCSTFDTKGFEWGFLRRQGRVRQWIIFQRHKYDNAFTVELSWSCVSDHPVEPPFGGPTDAFSAKGCRFRLGAFWQPCEDFWWHVWDPAPSLADMSNEDFSKYILEEPEAIDMEKARPRIQAAVEDAIVRIREHALPYFARVAQWAASQNA